MLWRSHYTTHEIVIQSLVLLILHPVFSVLPVFRTHIMILVNSCVAKQRCDHGQNITCLASQYDVDNIYTTITPISPRLCHDNPHVIRIVSCRSSHWIWLVSTRIVLVHHSSAHRAVQLNQIDLWKACLW
jgi:hypothetical protein